MQSNLVILSTPYRVALFEQAKEPMAHIQHLGSCLLDCGAQQCGAPARCTV